MYEPAQCHPKAVTTCNLVTVRGVRHPLQLAWAYGGHKSYGQSVGHKAFVALALKAKHTPATTCTGRTPKWHLATLQRQWVKLQQQRDNSRQPQLYPPTHVAIKR
jgi:hypothetical protein